MLKRFIWLNISLIVFCADSLLHMIYKLFGRKTNQSCVILYYHAIKKTHQNKFTKQLNLITKYSKIISAGHTLKLDNSARYVGLTFDDGFICVSKYAVPELSERLIPFTIFVPTAHIGQEAKWIKDVNEREMLMDKSVLKLLSRNHMATIGSHCVTHRDQNQLDDKTAKREIYESKKVLEEIIGKPVNLLSFPHGAYGERDIITAREAGYKRIFSITPHNALRGPDEFVTGRIRTTPDDWQIELFLKISGAYRWLPYAFLIKKNVIGFLKKNH